MSTQFWSRLLLSSAMFVVFCNSVSAGESLSVGQIEESSTQAAGTTMHLTPLIPTQEEESVAQVTSVSQLSDV